MSAKKRIYVGYLTGDEEALGFHGEIVSWKISAQRPVDHFEVITWKALSRIQTNVYDPKGMIPKALEAFKTQSLR